MKINGYANRISGNFLQYVWTSSPQQTLKHTKDRIRKHIKTFEKEVEAIHRQDVRNMNNRIKDTDLENSRKPAWIEEATGPSSRNTVSTVSMFRNYAFFGRDDELESLQSKFFPPDESEAPDSAKRSGNPVCCVLHGLGGSGKTRTALEYTYRYRDDYDAMFWLPAERDPEMAASFALIAVELGLVENDGKSDVRERHNQVKAIQQARNWLQQTGMWALGVLIFR